jgi:hypothetical protein
LTNKVSTVDGLLDADAGEDEGGDDDDEPEEPGVHFIKFFSPDIVVVYNVILMLKHYRKLQLY